MRRIHGHNAAKKLKKNLRVADVLDCHDVEAYCFFSWGFGIVMH